MVVRMTISVGPTPSDLKQSMDDVRETFDETRVDTPNTSRFPMVSTFSRQPLEVQDQVLYLDVAAFAPARAARNETRLADCWCHRWPAGEVVETSQNWTGSENHDSNPELSELEASPPDLYKGVRVPTWKSTASASHFSSALSRQSWNFQHGMGQTWIFANGILKPNIPISVRFWNR